MLVFSVVSVSLFVGYSVLILVYYRGWLSVPVFLSTHTPRTGITVIIPARNESANIGNLLNAIYAQQYPAHLLQVIVIDDHSTDDTAVIAGSYAGVLLLQLDHNKINSYKKKAVETGISHASGELIICTDADCIPAPGWLLTMAGFYEETNAAFIAAPVMIHPGRSALSIFQSMDFLVLQGITAASVQRKIHAMCNGANMAYQKAVFHEVNGFDGIDHIASGDDLLLMHKIRSRYPDRVHYLLSPDAIVYTDAQPTIRTFLNQRIRWASKATSYQEKNMLPVLLLVYLFNLLFPVLLLAGFIYHTCWWLVLWLWLAKTTIELPFYLAVAGFYKMRWSACLLVLFQPFHIMYTVLSGLLGQFRGYEWKGRKVS